MGYLRLLDYHTLISEANLATILKQARGILGDSEILESSELRGIASLKNSLRGRYVVDTVFAPFKNFNIAASFLFDDRIDFTAQDYNAATVYSSGEMLLYASVVYQKNATTAGYVAGTLPTDTNYFTNRGLAGIYHVTPPEDFNLDTSYTVGDKVKYKHKYYLCVAESTGNKPENTDFWERITDLTTYSITGVWPNQSGWTFADNRDASIVECLIDYILYDVHAVINPRNIPALRSDRMNKSVEWLKDIRTGKYDLGLPELGGQTGFKLRFGSNLSSVNYY